MLTLFLACTAPAPPGSMGGADATPARIPAPAARSAQSNPLGVCINEFVPNNQVSALDPNGSASDWIELHNPTDQDVALDGWSVTDDPTEPRKDVLDGGLVLEAGGFLVLWADASPNPSPDHLSFALSEDGEAVGLFTPDGVGSVVRYGPVSSDLAVARSTDCCFDEAEGCFSYSFAGTPGASNGR